MKKMARVIVVLSCVVLGGLSFSYWTSKNVAENVRSDFQGEVSELKGKLVLFQGDKFKPCWVFRGEYVHVMSGATFDVTVSLLGHLLKEPVSETTKGAARNKGTDPD